MLQVFLCLQNSQKQDSTIPSSCDYRSRCWSFCPNQ